MSVDSLQKLFLHELKDAYSAEKQITVALPKIIKQVQDPELKENLEEHLKETEGQIKRLDKVFKMLDRSPQAHLCQATQGILAEGEEALGETEVGVVDVAICASTARVEHYEQVLYTGLYELAKMLDMDDAAELFQETLDEEITAGKKVEKAMKKAMKIAPVGK